MAILVTGAAGFIGYHLCNRLLNEGFQVVGFDNINDYKVVNGKIKEIDFSHSLGYNLIVAFSIDNKTLPIGEHILFELRICFRYINFSALRFLTEKMRFRQS